MNFCRNLKNSKFCSFWGPLCSLDDRIWFGGFLVLNNLRHCRQKWTNAHTMRLILTQDLPLPDRIFTPANKGRTAEVHAEMAFEAMHDKLVKLCTFMLVKYQLYVMFVYG